ncbi:MAG: ABC transporter ATP-binding protein [Planctomycetes bacterium]|nr:ABC transporter ATP-binding protein [Planctomycetota bacterium]
MSPDHKPSLTLSEVRFGFESRTDFLGPVSLSVAGGECWAIVGPNGAGKSTLLRIMAGQLAPKSGSVTVCGRPMRQLASRARAKLVAFVPQHPMTDLDDSVREVVLMGRFPHRQFGLFESSEDQTQADRAMGITGTSLLADRRLKTLSGGEAQRVHVAAALAQGTDVLLLDEPTASLDLVHQQTIFRILHARAKSDGLAVVVVTHDVNLAAQFCTHVLVLDDGRCAAVGTPDDVLTPEVLAPVYNLELLALTSPDTPGRRWLVPAARQSDSGQTPC